MSATFFMKYKEPIKYGFIKLLQFKFLSSLHRKDYTRELAPVKYNTGIGTPFPSAGPVHKIDYCEDLVRDEPKPLVKKHKDKTKDYDWPAAVKSNGGLRGSKATTHRRFR